MPGINDLIATIEVELEACQKRQAKSLKERELIITLAQQEGRSNLTADEDTRIEELRAQHDGEKDSEKGIRAKLATAQEVAAESAENDKKAREITRTEVLPPRHRPFRRQVLPGRAAFGHVERHHGVRPSRPPHGGRAR
jgi:hypothetical protein